MAKRFGIAALVLAILSMFSPYAINFAVIWVGMICAAVAALNGDRGLTIASVVIAFAGLLLFAPVTLAVILTAAHSSDYAFLIIGCAPMGIATVALVIDATRRSRENSATAS